MSMADIRAAARQAVHDQFAVPAVYTDPNGVQTSASPDGSVNLTVRWHDKVQGQVGNLAGSDYGQVYERIDTILFSTANLAAVGITLARLGTVFIPSIGITFELDSLAPLDGPVNVTWNVVRALA